MRAPFLILLLLLTPAWGDEFVTFAVGENARDWILDPASGRVFAAMRDGVAEYDPTTGRTQIILVYREIWLSCWRRGTS